MNTPCEWCQKTSEQIDSLEHELEEAKKFVTEGIELMEIMNATIIEQNKTISELITKSNILTGRNNEIH